MYCKHLMKVTWLLLAQLLLSEAEVPDKPSRVSVAVVNATAIAVEWSPPTPKDCDQVIRGYYIFVQPVDDSTGVDELSGDTFKYHIMYGNAKHYTIVGLSPETTYTIQVGAYTLLEDGELAKAIKVRTPARVPDAPRIVNVQVSDDEGEVAVRIDFAKPEETYGALTGFRFTSGVKGAPLANIMHLEPGVGYVKIKRLNRGMNYEFKIAAMNSIGAGAYAVKEVLTPEGVPTGAPQNISYSFESPSAIRITWDPPALDRQNGQIIQYTVYLEVNGSIIGTNVTAGLFEFDQLELRRVYVFRISAWTSKGEGKASLNLEISTPAEVLPPPENVRVAAINDTHALVWWSAIPDTPAIKVTGYRVRIQCVKEPLQLCTHASTEDIEHATSTVLSGLEAGRIYSVYVAGRAQRNVGQVSKKVIFRAAPEEVPKDVTVVAVTKDSITLRWKPPLAVIPSRYHLSFKGKRVFVDETNTTQIRVTPGGSHETTNTEYTIQGLRPHTTYQVNLTAVRPDGRDAPPVQLEIKTSADAVAKQGIQIEPPYGSSAFSDEISSHLNTATPEARDVIYHPVIMGPTNFTVCAGSEMSFPTIYDNLIYHVIPATSQVPNTGVYAWDYDRSTSTRNPHSPGIGRVDTQFYHPGAPSRTFAPPVVFSDQDQGFWLVSAGNGRYQLGSANPAVYPTVPFKQTLKISVHALKRQSLMATKDVTVTIDPTCTDPRARF